ncbi:hypothetical protein RSPO_c01941 [Ralstonia solanacearum Po82]|uniref:Uncharacterized protein n=1 Tax=Ralstonia solanacearum (strain Po82) TaxID=1031711 RepID=F6G1V7_RALS8|nr:hypothetical protein RSPO_c01941 [Ralstonia solanacearum Po82]
MLSDQSNPLNWIRSGSTSECFSKPWVSARLRQRWPGPATA